MDFAGFLKNTLSSKMEGIRPMTRALFGIGWDAFRLLWKLFWMESQRLMPITSLDFDREVVYAFILKQSVQALLEEVARDQT